MKGMTEIARTCDGCWMPTADDGLISNTGEKALMIANHDNSHNYRPIDSSSSTMALFGAMNVSLLNKGLKKGMRGSTLTTPPPTPPRPQISSQNIASLSPKGPSPIKPPRQRKQGTSYPAITTLEDSTSSIHSSFEFNMASGNFSSYVSTCVSIESIVTDTSSAFSSSVYAETSSCTTTGQFTVNTTSKSSSVFGCNKSDHLPTPSSGGFEPTSVREIYTPPRRAGFLEDEDRINNDTMNLVDTAQYGAHTSLDHSEWDAPVFIPTSPPISAHVHSDIPSAQVPESPCSLSAEDNDRPIPALIVSPIATSQRLALGSERHNISTIPHLLSHVSPPLPPKSTRSFEAGSTLSSSFGETSPMFVANQKRRDSIKKLVEVSDILSCAPKVEDVILQCSTPSLSLNSPSRREISPFRSDLSSSITEREPKVDKVTEILNHRVIEKPVMLPPPPSSFSAASHTSASAAGKVPKSCQQSHAGSTIKSHPTNSEPKPIPIKFGREDSKRASQSQSSPTINQDTPLAWQKVMLSPPGPRLTLVERRISQFNSPSATTMSPASSAADRMSTKMKCSPVRTISHNSKIPSKDVSNRTTESEREMDREMQTESTVYALDVDAATHASNDQLLDHDVDASTDVKSKKPQLILSNNTRLSTDPAELIDLTQSNKSARSIGPILPSSIKELNVSVPQQNMRESVLEVRCEEEKTPARSRYLAHIETASNEKEKMKEKEKAYGKPGLLSEALKEKVRVLTAVAVVARKWENTSAPLNNFPTESMVCLVSEDGPVSTSSNLPISSTSNVSYEKYDFMRGMKISERTVRLMMLADGLHSSEIQAYSPMDSVSA